MRIPNISQLVVGLASGATTRATGTAITAVTSSFCLTQITIRSKFARILPNKYLRNTREALMSPDHEATENTIVDIDCRNGSSSA